jgi:predicted anti-sigma-YlaC factor YlaD
VRCSSCREALSAWIDGESHHLWEADAAAHLVACVSCRRWHEDVVRLNRFLRVRPTARAPDLISSILVAAPPAQPPPSRGGRPACRWGAYPWSS